MEQAARRSPGVQQVESDLLCHWCVAWALPPQCINSDTHSLGSCTLHFLGKAIILVANKQFEFLLAQHTQGVSIGIAIPEVLLDLELALSSHGITVAG